MTFCSNNWPPKDQIKSQVKKYLHVSSQLSIEDSLLLRGTQIVNLVFNCPIYQKERVQRPESLCPTPFPELPWQKLGANLFWLEGVQVSFDGLLLLQVYWDSQTLKMVKWWGGKPHEIRYGSPLSSRGSVSVAFMLITPT